MNTTKKTTNISIFFFLIILILSIGCRNDKEIITHYVNGSIMEKYKVKKGTNIIVGKYEMYSPKNKISVIMNYSDGVLDGDYFYYCEDSDFILEKGNYVNGKLQGEIVHYYCNDSIKYSIQYGNDKIWNALLIKSKDGVDLDKGTLLNGNGTIFKYNAYGTLTKKYNIKEGFKNSWQYDYSKTGFIDSFYYENGFNKKLNVYDNAY